MGQKKVLRALLAAAGMVTAGSTSAIVITPTLDATILGNALLGGGGTGIDLTTVSVSVSGHSGGGAVSAGTYTNDSGTYGIGPGVVISSGDVNAYETGPNTSDSTTTIYGAPASAAQEGLLDPITGNSYDHFDVTQINISFDMLSGFDTVFFNVTFGSEEYPEYLGDVFVDGFGLLVNGVNIADVVGLPVNINHPDMQSVPGTELDGILGGSQGTFGPYVHTFSQFVGDGNTGNTLTLIVADTSDAEFDTTAYISQLGGSEPPSVVPVPAPLALLGLGLAVLVTRQRR